MVHMEAEGDPMDRMALGECGWDCLNVLVMIIFREAISKPAFSRGHFISTMNLPCIQQQRLDIEVHQNPLCAQRDVAIGN